jgi:hypothetical protein
MQKIGFYTRIAIAINRPLTRLELELLDIAFEEDPVLLARHDRETATGKVSTTKGKLPEFIDLADVPARVANGPYGPWLYDRTTKTWLIGMAGGMHEYLMGALHGLFSKKRIAVAQLEAEAEQYIEYKTASVTWMVSAKCVIDGTLGGLTPHL